MIRLHIILLIELYCNWKHVKLITHIHNICFIWPNICSLYSEKKWFNWIMNFALRWIETGKKHNCGKLIESIVFGSLANIFSINMADPCRLSALTSSSNDFDLFNVRHTEKKQNNLISICSFQFDFCYEIIWLLNELEREMSIASSGYQAVEGKRKNGETFGEDVHLKIILRKTLTIHDIPLHISFTEHIDDSIKWLLFLCYSNLKRYNAFI